MPFMDFFKRLFGSKPPKFVEDYQYPKDGILWRGWSDETAKLIQEKGRPVLLFVANTDGLVWPFLKAVLEEMPKNAKLRELLHSYYFGLFMKDDAIPEYFSDLGAGSRYNIAVLSPAGLTPLCTIDPAGGKPEEIVTTITKVLIELQKTY